MGYRRPTVRMDGKQRVAARVVMARALGRALLTEELVHHIDHNPCNNELSNLQIVSRAEHKRLHPEIGLCTRLTKRWHLDAAELSRRMRTETAREIAASIGCSENTVLRTVRAVLLPGESLQSRRWLRPHPAPHKRSR